MKQQTENPIHRIKPVFTDNEIRDIEKLNPKKEALTAEKLRMFSGCEHYSHEAAVEIVKTIHQIALVLYESTRFKKSISIDNQLVVNLTKEEELDTSQQKLNAA